MFSKLSIKLYAIFGLLVLLFVIYVLYVNKQFKPVTREHNKNRRSTKRFNPSISNLRIPSSPDLNQIKQNALNILKSPGSERDILTQIMNTIVKPYEKNGFQLINDIKDIAMSTTRDDKTKIQDIMYKVQI
jgi:predicted PurR-regulated permease PerM